jgi:multimeric flavodoxin WrbA
MQTLMILGSRNPKGQTARAAGALLSGVGQAGGTSDTLVLPLLRLERCRQCNDDGWGLCRAEGKCAIDDQFAEIVKKLGRADSVVFATPVYYGDLSESLRALTDRLRRTCTHKNMREKIEGKIAAGVCVAGGGGGGSLPCCVSLSQVLSTCGFNVLDMIPVRRQNLEAKLTRLELVGQWLAQQPAKA